MKVSIIITAYGRKNFVEEALNSAIEQFHENIETEIIFVKNFNDARIDGICKSNGIITIDREGSIGEYLSNACARATGDVIMFLEDDDVFTDGKIKKIIDLFASNKNVLFIHNGYCTIDDFSRKIQYKRLLDKHHSAGNFNLIYNYRSRKLLDFISSSNADFNLSSMSMRKDLITPDFLAFLSSIKSNPDAILLYYSLSTGGDVLATSEVLTKYRVHNQGISQSKNFSVKAGEVKKELDALQKLKIFLMEQGPLTQAILQIIDLTIAEFTLMYGLFEKTLSRSEILNLVLKLVIFDRRIYNVLRTRLIIFGILNAISANCAERLYGFLRIN